MSHDLTFLDVVLVAVAVAAVTFAAIVWPTRRAR